MAGAPRFLFGDFEFDAGTFELRRGADARALEPKALDVLRLLLERAPQVVEKEEIFAIVWKDVAVTDNALTRVIAQLRKALADDARSPSYISTVSTRGYRMLTPVSLAASAPGDQAPSSTAVTPQAVHRRWSRAAVTTVTPTIVAIAVTLAVVTGAAAWLALQADSGATGRSGLVSAATLDVATMAALTPAQVTTGRGFDGFLAYSPDGSSIAYSSDRSGTMEVYAEGLAPGSVATRLTTNGHQNVQPVWSPDGRLIAYHDMAENGIWVVSSRGGSVRMVSPFGAHPSWSPDGRRLVFQSQATTDLNPGGSFGATSTIWTIELSGRAEPVPLTRPGQPEGSHGMPAWWPDGRHVVFAVQSPSGARTTSALWTITVDGADPRPISTDARVSAEFAISPDGRGIYFSARATHGLWWLPVEDLDSPASEPRPTGLPVTGSSLSGIAVSPDGRHVGWTAHDSAATIWEVAATGNTGVAPAPLIPINAVGWRAGYPALSSDGQVAFMGNRGNTINEIFLVVPGAEPRQLTGDGRDHGAPLWLAGDREIAVIADHGDGPGFWALDPASGQERLLFPLGAVPKPANVQSRIGGPSAGLALAPDLSKVAAAFTRNGVPNVWTIALGHRGPTGPFVQRTFEKDGGSYAAWSPNGAWLAYQCRQDTDSNICAIGADGASRVQLTRDQGESFLGGWSADNDTILFAARRRAVWNITRVSRASGVAQALTSFTEPRFYVRYPRWDAAHERVVFERFETRGALWSVTLPPAP